MIMFGDHARHRERKRKSCIQRPPAVMVDEREPAASIAPDLAHDSAIGDDDKKLGHLRSFLAAFTTVSMSTEVMSSLDRRRRSPGSIVKGRSRAARVRRTKPSSARVLPLEPVDGDDPLPSDPRLAGEFGLAQLELSASVANDQPEVQRGSNLHHGPNVVERQQYACVVERMLVENVHDRRLLRMSAFGYMSEKGAKPLLRM